MPLVLLRKQFVTRILNENYLGYTPVRVLRVEQCCSVWPDDCSSRNELCSLETYLVQTLPNRVRRCDYLHHKWGLMSCKSCDCGVDPQTVKYYVVKEFPERSPPKRDSMVPSVLANQRFE